jgi:hypothetical protein
MKEFVLVIYAITYQCLLYFSLSFDQECEKKIQKNCTKVMPLTTRFYFCSLRKNKIKFGTLILRILFLIPAEAKRYVVGGD